MKTFGSQSMVAPIKRVLMRRPGKSLLAADANEWHYGSLFDAPKAIAQYDVFAKLVAESGAEITWLEDNGDGLCDAMFTQDASLVTDHGVVLLNMGKPLRVPEPAMHGEAYEAAGVPVIGKLTGNGRIEGGDFIWLNNKTIVVGCGFRSNREGIAQLNAILNPYEINVVGFDLPVWQGAEACLHLMSMISPLDDKLALIYSPLMPTAFYQLLLEEGFTLLDAPAEEFLASGGLNLNVLPVKPSECIMIDGFPKTKKMMEEAGCTVHVFEGDALCIACEGGPTCLTNTILRA
ncbi:Arginine deiminase [Marinomonas spartinae]|uniref:dimethylarginine dimethylaminohydrolase family protein n=1 Tax=Marinomonas spartinae TaxID=1792290 RepID=UPI000808F8C0|nr:arginine deiminase family protein [Marinomonas spartinae]SBS39366.1 Arginine deiminase [Marinomonas spartinae]